MRRLRLSLEENDGTTMSVVTRMVGLDHRYRDELARLLMEELRQLELELDREVRQRRERAAQTAPVTPWNQPVPALDHLPHQLISEESRRDLERQMERWNGHMTPPFMEDPHGVLAQPEHPAPAVRPLKSDFCF